MDAYSIHGDHYYQGYLVQAPPPGTVPNQAPPPGTVPVQPPTSASTQLAPLGPPGVAPAQLPVPVQLPVPASTPLAPPGVAPSPSSTAVSYYGTYAPPPPYGFHPPPAETWSSYPVPTPETQPYPPYPPALPFDHPSHNQHSFHQQDPFLYTHNFTGPPQAFMPLPPRGSDVTQFRKKRPFLPHQNLRPRNKPFKHPQENFRGGGKNPEQVQRAFNSDPRTLNATFNGIPMANNAQILHPLWQGRGDEASANRVGKRPRVDGRGEGRPGAYDDRRKGDKWARPGWIKGKHKKGRKQGGDNSSMDPIGNAQGTSPTVRASETVPMTGGQAQEAAVWLALHRDVRKRVQEFLYTSERESLRKMRTQDTQEASIKEVNGNANTEMQHDTQEPTLKVVGGDVNVDMQDTQQEVAGGVANSQMQNTQVEVGGDAYAEMQDPQEAVNEALSTEEAIQEALCADANAHMAEIDVAVQLDPIDTQQANNIDSSHADHINALHSDHLEENQSDQVQSGSVNLILPNAYIDVVQSEAIHSDEVHMENLDIVDIPKHGSEQLATEIVQDLKVEGVQEFLGVDEEHNKETPLLESAYNSQLATEIVQDLKVDSVQEFPGVDEEHNKQTPPLETACNSEKKYGKDLEAPTEEELKEREERTFKFFTKLLEENKDLRNMYIEKCNDGLFECFMCHSKIRKRFSNLVSLVTHANNVLKTKKLPEHRGYGRAVCSLFGWDPHRIPQVPKNQVSHLGAENVPANDERAPVSDGNGCVLVGNTLEHAHVPYAINDGHETDAVKGVLSGNAVKGEADDGVVTVYAVEGGPVGNAESKPLGDADGCSSVEQANDTKLQSMKGPARDFVYGILQSWRNLHGINKRC